MVARVNVWAVRVQKCCVLYCYVVLYNLSSFWEKAITHMNSFCLKKTRIVSPQTLKVNWVSIDRFSIAHALQAASYHLGTLFNKEEVGT